MEGTSDPGLGSTLSAYPGLSFHLVSESGLGFSLVFPVFIKKKGGKKKKKGTTDIAQSHVWLGLLATSESETVNIHLIMYSIQKQSENMHCCFRGWLRLSQNEPLFCVEVNKQAEQCVKVAVKPLVVVVCS